MGYFIATLTRGGPMNAAYLPDPLRIAERLNERYQERARRPFEDFSTIQQLDALEVACRNDFFARCRLEALPESDDFGKFLCLLTDSTITADEVGRVARELVLKYVQACAQRRGEDLAEFVS